MVLKKVVLENLLDRLANFHLFNSIPPVPLIPTTTTSTIAKTSLSIFFNNVEALFLQIDFIYFIE